MSFDHHLRGLKSRRLNSGVLASELAVSIGVTLNSYYRFETGARRIFLDRAAVLARMIGSIKVPTCTPTSTPGWSISDHCCTTRLLLVVIA